MVVGAMRLGQPRTVRMRVYDSYNVFRTPPPASPFAFAWAAEYDSFDLHIDRPGVFNGTLEVGVAEPIADDANREARIGVFTPVVGQYDETSGDIWFHQLWGDAGLFGSDYLDAVAFSGRMILDQHESPTPILSGAVGTMHWLEFRPTLNGAWAPTDWWVSPAVVTKDWSAVLR